MSSMILVSSSSFFLPDYLIDKLLTDDYSQGEFDFALKNDYTAALLLEEKKQKVGSVAWFKIIKKLGNYHSESALKVGKWYQKQITSAPQYTQGIQESNNFQAILWLEHAIYLGEQEAILLLAQLYYHQQEYHLAQSTINQLSGESTNKDLANNSFILSLKLAIYFGDENAITELIANYPYTQISEELEQLIKTMLNYSVVNFNVFEQHLNIDAKSRLRTIKSNIKASSSKSPIENCQTNLQLFATSLEHLQHLDRLTSKFTQQAVSSFICLSTPMYLSKQALECVSEPDKAITCNESKWQSLVSTVKTKYIGLMLEQGGANVHFGVLYFNQDDDINVFTHEVTHLLGFVDEYPLPESHRVCQSIQSKPFSHNIAVLKNYYLGQRKHIRETILTNIPWSDQIKQSTPILLEVENNGKQKRWKLGTPFIKGNPVGVYIAETCQKMAMKNAESLVVGESNYSAFKPLSIRTKLRYNESMFPQEYMNQLTSSKFDYLMPSYHYNIALALYQRGDISMAKDYLQLSSVFEQNMIRKSMVLKGAL